MKKVYSLFWRGMHQDDFNSFQEAEESMLFTIESGSGNKVDDYEIRER